MKVFLREIKEVDTEFSYTEKEPWVLAAVGASDEISEAVEVGGILSTAPIRAVVKPRPILAQFTLRKLDNIFEVDGKIKTSLNLLCSRCATQYAQKSDIDFAIYYSKDPQLADIHAGKDELEINFLTEDFIDLAELLSEQIQLQIPFQPLCKEGCKGMCQTCGADLNSGRCACEKIAQNNPFSVLKDLVK